eukprot:maker-scaffold224_size251237-snap-gene-1.51 protein:Tk05450 transcript:maker-scaffold224_size251237-snap-gene-1.51-mRNA-1 annotation:"predicted protein"
MHENLSHAELLAVKVKLLRDIRQQTQINRKWEDLSVLEWHSQIKQSDVSDPSSDGAKLLAEVAQVFGSRMGRGLVQQQSLESTEQLHAWTIDEFKSQIGSIQGGNDITTEWRVSFRLKSHPGVILAFKFDALSKDLGEMPEVSDLQIAFPAPMDHSRLVLINEIDPLIDYCERRLDFATAFKAIAHYLDLSVARSERIQAKQDDLELMSATIDNDLGLAVHFVSESHQALATLHWWLAFSENTMSFESAYKVVFTTKGKVTAVSCNFSKQFIETGDNPDWSADYCFDNLCRMTFLAEASNSPDTSRSSKRRISARRKRD